MKRVHGTIVRRIIVEETAYQTDAYCDECLAEQELRPRPEEPKVDDEFDVTPADDEVLEMMRNAIPGVVREEGPETRIVGYRCGGCDRRLDLGEKVDGGNASEG